MLKFKIFLLMAKSVQLSLANQLVHVFIILCNSMFISLSSILNTVECYDPSSNCWYFVKSMAEARMGACAAEYGGQIYIAGGYGSRKMDLELNITILDSFECFNPHSNK